MFSQGQRLLAKRLSYQIRAGSSRMRIIEPHDAFLRSTPSAIRHLSTKQQQDGEKQQEEKSKESLEDTVKRMQGDKKNDDDALDPRLDGFFRSASESWSTFSEELGKTWKELLKSGERKDINKKLLHPEDTVEGEAEYTGPVEIMVIDESEHLTAWEKMQRRLTDAPIIQGKYTIG